MNPNDKAVELLLLETRKSIADENPNEALSSLLEAIRISQGEEAIMGILDAAHLEAFGESRAARAERLDGPEAKAERGEWDSFDSPAYERYRQTK